MENLIKISEITVIKNTVKVVLSDATVITNKFKTVVEAKEMFTKGQGIMAIKNSKKNVSETKKFILEITPKPKEVLVKAKKDKISKIKEDLDKVEEVRIEEASKQKDLDFKVIYEMPESVTKIASKEEVEVVEQSEKVIPKPIFPTNNFRAE
jgi:hypothetical protein